MGWEEDGKRMGRGWEEVFIELFENEVFHCLSARTTGRYKKQ